jgi:hypothetical protein
MILRDGLDRKRISAQVSLSEEKAGELLSLCGRNLAALRSASITRDFHPMDLHASVLMQVKNEVRRVDSPNVVALLKGSDPGLRNEYVIYTGHWDHVGQEGDRIYHGASEQCRRNGRSARASSGLHEDPSCSKALRLIYVAHC